MADRTGIEWTDATWNPLRGCSRVSEGCRNCYAERVAARFSGPGQPYEGLARMRALTTGIGPRGAPYGETTPAWTGVVKLIEEHLADPLRWRRPRRVFVNSMSDLFHPEVPDEWIDRVFAVMAIGSQGVARCFRRDCSHDPCEGDGTGLFTEHVFQVLTKRPERARAYLSHPERQDKIAEALSDVPGFMFADSVHENLCAEWPLRNVWLGVSVEDADHRDRIDVLRQTPAAVRFVSFEPLIGELRDFCMDGIAWAIFGGESGPGARPCDVAWIRSGMATCRHYGTAVFVKQLGARPYDSLGIAAHVTLHPEDNRTISGAPSDADLRAMERLVNAAAVPLRKRDPKGGDMAAWPETIRDLRVREFPDVARFCAEAERGEKGGADAE